MRSCSLAREVGAVTPGLKALTGIDEEGGKCWGMQPEGTPSDQEVTALGMGEGAAREAVTFLSGS